MATGSPFGPHRNAMDVDPEIRIRIREIRIFRKFFFAFFASMDLLGPQGHPPDGPESPNPDPDREIRFFENPDFSIFRLFKLKDPTIWVSMDSLFFPFQMEYFMSCFSTITNIWVIIIVECNPDAFSFCAFKFPLNSIFLASICT